MSTPVVVVEHLVFEYPARRALDDVSFAVQRGAITALVGPNGAGKTTLLRCLAALHEPFSGSVLVDGVDVLEYPRECHRRVGYLSDFFGLYDDLSVSRCLQYVARAHGATPVEAERMAVLTAGRLGIEGLLAQPAGTLSRGLRQRLAIAQAIIHHPPVLLLDEPASGLDPEARHALAGLMLGLRDEGMTLIVSSHILAELEDYCTDMLILRDGRIVDHEPLAGAARDEQTVRVEVSGDPQLALAIARDVPGVREVTVEGGGLRVRLTAGGDERGVLLRALVEGGVGVTGLGSERERLQDAYIARVQAGPTATGERERDAGEP